MVREDRKWMYNLAGRKGLTDEFLAGVTEFIEFASSHHECMDGEKIRCPCRKCKNTKFLTIEEVIVHLYQRGFKEDYYDWTAHGETPMIVNEHPNTVPHMSELMNEWGTFEHMYWDQGMAFDGQGPSFVPNWGANQACYGTEYSSPYYNEVGPSVQAPIEEEDDVTLLSTKFFDMLKEADDPLYSGCESHSQLSMVARLLRIKAESNTSESTFNKWVQSFKEALPRDNILPNDFYGYKKLIRDLGLPVKKIDACKNGCMLYWKDDLGEEACKFCNFPRYKQRTKGRPNNPKRKRMAHSVLRYLPLTPRLQRLYASEVTAPHMTWHDSHEIDNGVMCHPSDAEAWKHFDRTHPSFASEPRNIRLGLCADGFAPHGQYGKTYSCWPVIVTPYNLPPGMCMKSPYMFLTLICPGPNNPKKNIDVYLQPLIEELKQLWDVGEETYDVSRKEKFTMKAALMWTVNDFPAYGMLSGWSTSGLLGCPICMEKSMAFYLQHGKKASYFDCHRQFLPLTHQYRKDKKCFTRGRVVSNAPPPRLTGEEIFNRVQEFETAIENPCGKPHSYGHDHKWTKKSIFWDLPYWKTNLIRHNLDVMHIEKNVFDNVMNTVMDVKGKTKDNLNARKDINLYCSRPEIAINDENSRLMRKAVYTLTKEQKKKICEWVHCLRFPYGYASNLARCIDMNEYKLRGMKSHDCHVFMQRLIPIAFREMLPDFVWGSLTELSLFFQTICSVVLDINKIRELKNDVAVMLCNLEKIFPPAFFDSMEHLIIHLPYETLIGGPVQYRWMYPFER